MNEERPTSSDRSICPLSDVPGPLGSHLMSLMRVLVIIPQSCTYPSEQRSSSGMERFFTVCNQAWGLGFRRFSVSISAQATAANTSRLWGVENRSMTDQSVPQPPLHCSKQPQLFLCSRLVASHFMVLGFRRHELDAF